MSYPPPPAPAPSASGGKPRLRGRTPRLLGWIFLGLGIVALVAGIAVIASKAVDAAKDYKRVSVASGGGSVQLDRTGKWVVYYEADGAGDITRIPIAVEVTGPGGQQITVSRYRADGNKSTKITYDYNGVTGASVYQFDAPSKGTYQVRVQSDGSTPRDARVALGEDIVNGTVIAGGALVAVGVLLLIAAVVLLIVGFVKRGRHKRELAAGYGGGYGGGPGYSQPYGQQPYGQQPYGQQPGFGPPPQQ